MLHPYYMIDFSAAACMFEIRVNDYPVINMNVDGQVSTNIPINYAILKSGEQNITATILPNLGEAKLHTNTSLKFDIKLFDVANDFVFQNQLGEYVAEPVGNKSIPIIKYANKFEAGVPYTLKAWQDGALLKDIKDLKLKLIDAYNEIAGIIRNRKYDVFKERIKQREKNMSTSMYLSQYESESRVNELIDDFKNGFEMMPILEDYILHINGYGKVATLKRPNGESALYLKNATTDEELMIDISFYIPEGKTAFDVI